MLELLIAVTATVIMVLFLNQIFSAMSGGVSAGVATSDILQANSVFSRQIAHDAKAMVGPVDATINPVNTARGFIILLQREYEVSLREGDPPTRIRSDQIAWVTDLSLYSGVKPKPRTPGAYNSFADAESDASHARIWYGHVLKTNPDGSLPPGAVLGMAPNEYASKWVLGRQAMFLDGAPAMTTATYIDSTSPGSLYPDWDVAGYTNLEPGFDKNDFWTFGLSDVFDRNLDDLYTYFVGRYTDRPIELTYGLARLRCNPDLDVTQQYEAWQVAQMHSYLIGNVSHFQIDFAGDYLSPGTITLIGGQVAWFSHFWPVSDPATYPPPTTGSLPRFVKGNDPAAIAGTEPIYADEWNDGHTDRSRALPLITNDPTVSASSLLNGTDLPNAQAAFIFGSDAAAGWPYMIRIRYRIHDKNGRLADEQGNPGKLFERIIRVRDLLGQFDPE